MLKFIDDCGVFSRSVVNTFLLLDGHGSRMMLPFSSISIDLSMIGFVAMVFPMQPTFGKVDMQVD